ncbi:isoamyl alcohol [Moniliophthora roreri]|nr:isoamyl alcohol [Moniliophthora roreri]
MQRPLLSCSLFCLTSLVLLFLTLSDSWSWALFFHPNDLHPNLNLDFRRDTAHDQACKHLQSLLSPDIVALPHSSAYTNGTQAPWNGYNRDFSPACIVFPRETAHVQAAMKVIFENEIDYAVQAGGHSAMKGWNTVQNGVLISFTYMKAVTYDAQRDSITLQPGITWGEAVDALERFGVAPVGGRVSDVGTGLLLGGGLSFLSPRHGLGCDTYLELDVVLVDGTLVTATEDNEYKDLFKALKGGANRFGVVTRYEVKAVRTGTKDERGWFGGMVIFANASVQGMLEAVAEFTRDNHDPDATMLSFIANLVLNDPSHTVTTLPIASLLYNGTPRNLSQTETEEMFNKTFASFLSLAAIQSILKPLSYPEVSHLNDETPEMQGRGQFFGASTFGTAEDEVARYVQAYEATHSFAQEYKSILNSTVLAFTPIGETQINIGGNLMVSPGTRPYNAVQFQVTVQQPEQDRDLVFGAMERDRLAWFARFPGAEGAPLYINECDKKQRVFPTYCGFNIKHTDGPLERTARGMNLKETFEMVALKSEAPARLGPWPNGLYIWKRDEQGMRRSSQSQAHLEDPAMHDCFPWELMKLLRCCWRTSFGDRKGNSWIPRCFPDLYLEHLQNSTTAGGHFSAYYTSGD